MCYYYKIEYKQKKLFMKFKLHNVLLLSRSFFPLINFSKFLYNLSILNFILFFFDAFIWKNYKLPIFTKLYLSVEPLAFSGYCSSTNFSQKYNYNFLNKTTF